MIDITTIDFSKHNGLVPAIVQDDQTGKVLMLGYMNEAAIQKTYELGKVTFFSRSKGRLWTKGETSNNYLTFVNMRLDCDRDALLVKANPLGPVCHTGADTCFKEENIPSSFFHQLEKIVQERKANPTEKSYTSKLFRKGINKIAQKVGEEAVELVIEAKDDDAELFLGEAADLMYHYIVLLAQKNFSLADVEKVLANRHK